MQKMMLPNDSENRAAERKEKSPTQTERILKICSKLQLFHTPSGEPYASIPINDHVENWSLRNKEFKNWIGKMFFQETGSAPSTQAVQDAISVLEGRAKFDSPEIEVFLRVSRFNDKIYIDLADEKWRVVEISKTGWSVIEHSPVKFRRSKGMLPLPSPLRVDLVEYITKLKNYINIESHGDFQLIMAFIIAAFLPEGPFPILVPYGEQGTGKSTLVRVIRSIVDPNSTPLRREPRSVDDLMVSARNNWVIPFDNVSKLSDDLSDDLCRLSTGGGLSKREHYSDDGEIVLDAKRPCLLNGIEEFVTRGDLADRSIIISLPHIEKAKRSREETFWKEFENDRPGIFGAICSAIEHGLKEKDTFELEKKPRLADAFHWVSATETAFGWERGSTLKELFRNQKSANEVVLANSPLFKHLNKYASQGFRGSFSLLLQNIKNDADPSETRFLPSNTNVLGNKLRRLTPALKHAGIEVILSRTSSSRTVELRKIDEIVVTADIDDETDFPINDL